MNTFGRYDQMPPWPWEPLPEQQHQRGGGAEGTGDPGGNGGGGEGGPGAEDPSEGFSGPGGAADSPGRGGPSGPASGEGGNFGYDPGQQGRQNPGRGYFGHEITGPEQDALGGRGRDPGWDKPGGYDYGPNGDVVVKVDPVTKVRTFRLYDKAYDDWVDQQLEDAREQNPIAGRIATVMANGVMGQLMRATGRFFGQEIDADGNPIGPGAEPGEGGEPLANEADPDVVDPDATPAEPDTTEGMADEAYRQLLARLRRGRGTTDWQEPDYGWIYRMSGLEPPAPAEGEGAT